MIYLSASLIKDYLSCPKKAYYRIHKLGNEEGEESPEQLRGIIVHAVLEKAWKSKKDALKELAYQQKKYNFYLEQALINKCIDNFFEMFTGVFSDKDEIEKNFKLVQEGGYALTGRIDRIHNNVVFDWKTSERKPASVNDDIQFILYDIAYTQLYGKKPTSVTYVSLPTKSLVKYNRNEALVTEFKEQIIPNILHQIKENSLPRSGLYTYRGCYRCPFTKACYGDIGYERR